MLIKKIDTLDELKEMAFVHYKSWNETYMSMLGEDYLKTRTYDSQVEKTIKSYNDGKISLIARENGKAVGFITYGIYKNEESIKGEIFALYVLKDYQHKKIGYELMTRALNELSECSCVTLWLFKDNKKALSFYERLGFKLTGQTKVAHLGIDVIGIEMIRS